MAKPQQGSVEVLVEALVGPCAIHLKRPLNRIMKGLNLRPVCASAFGYGVLCPVHEGPKG